MRKANSEILMSDSDLAFGSGLLEKGRAYARRITTLAVVVLALLAGDLIGAGAAFSATGHGFLAALEEAPPGSRLVEPGAVAVDHASGDVFVADEGQEAVDVFDASGAFVTQIRGESLLAAGVAVDEASGLVYVADTFTNAVLVFKPDGSTGYTQASEWLGEAVPGTEFGEVAGIAVDNSNSTSAGDVYVVDSESPETGFGAVYVLKPHPPGPEADQEGDLVRVLDSGKMEEPNGIAVDGSSGRVLVADSVKGGVYEYAASGVFEGKMTGATSPQGSFGAKEAEGNVAAVASESGTGNLLVAEAERHTVSEFDSNGQWVGWITDASGGMLGEPRGLAISATGSIYVADAGLHLVDIFGPAVIVPDVTTSKASKIARTTAALNGTVDGDGKAATYHFEWGTSEALGSSTPVTATAGSLESVSVTLSQLHPSTTYFFRLAAQNENGADHGIIRQFTTPTAVEGLKTGPVNELEPEEATLTGSLVPKGIDAHYYFEWGTTSKYGHTTPEPPGLDAGTSNATVTAEAGIDGLAPNTTYHYHLVATNELGKTEGEDKTFKTSGPPTITNEPSTGITHDTATINAKVNPNQLATTYHYEYGKTTGYGTEVPLGGTSVGSGSEPVPTSASLGGLEIGTTYHYRIVASNSAGTTTGADQTFLTVPPALIHGTAATGVGSAEGTLQAEINPLGNPTTYYLEYGTESCAAQPSGCVDTPSPPGIAVGDDESEHFVSDAITGLQPATVYHYRMVAVNVLGTAYGPERTFTTRAGLELGGLPDGRAWEMVSPPDKQGAPVEALTREGGLILASQSGDALSYLANGALGENVQGNRSPEWQQVLAKRGASGWDSHDIATPSSKAKGVAAGAAPEYQFFTPDLSTALVEPAGLGAEPPLAPGVSHATIYLRDASGTFLPLVSDGNTAPDTNYGEEHIHFVGATPNLSNVVISSKVALTGPSSAAGLYEWTNGELELVSILPNGTPAHGLVEFGTSHTRASALSTDGTRIIWTTAEEKGNVGHLYMRDTVTAETVKLDAAQGVSEPIGTGTARFQAASSDGLRVFFTDKQRLTPDSTADPLLGRPDLYECEMRRENGKSTCKLTDLTVDANPGERANVQGLLFGASSDGTIAFFVAQGVLADNENGNHEEAVAGKNNLYEVHNDEVGPTTTFVATLSSEDSPEWEGNGISNTAFLTARVSPNGRYLAFMSAAPITGYDNVDQNSGQSDDEVFLYDAATKRLGCASCNPTGERPSGVLDVNESGEGLGLLVDRRKIWLGHWLAANIPGWTAQSLTTALYQSRYLSDDGRLYFNSPDRLVAAARNGKESVYQYEPTGVGSCTSPSGACISLISSASSDHESAFVEATPDGSDVFFLTEAHLLPQDTDTAFDLYDARECGDSPCLTPPGEPPPSCSSTPTCRPAQPPQQILGGPSGTEVFTGPGNVAFLPAGPKNATLGTEVKKPKRSLTRAQRLSKALTDCRKHFQRSKSKRRGCERNARKRYAAKHSVKKPTPGRGKR